MTLNLHNRNSLERGGLFLVDKNQQKENGPGLPSTFPGFKEIIKIKEEDLDKEAWAFGCDYAKDVIKEILSKIPSIMTLKNSEKLNEFISSQMGIAKLHIVNVRFFQGSDFAELWQKRVIKPIADAMSDYNDLLKKSSKNPEINLSLESDRLLKWCALMEVQEKELYEVTIRNIISVFEQQVRDGINSKLSN